jgi:uncharacterized phage infection (PIP) family protein YhgE
MSKAPKKAAAAAAPAEEKPAEAAAPATEAKVEDAKEAAPAAEEAAKPTKKAKKAETEVTTAPAKAPIDEAIEIALASAGTAVDSAQEIQRLRSEVDSLVSKGRRTNMILMYATLLLIVFGGCGLFGALVFYKRAYNEFEAVAKVNRDALLVFAGEINGLVATSKKIDDSIASTGQQLTASNAQLEEVKKALAGFATAQNALVQKLSVPPPAPDMKPVENLKQGLDDLNAQTKAIATKVNELAQRPAAPAASASSAPRVLSPPPAPVIRGPGAAQNGSSRRVSERDNMLRYP